MNILTITFIILVMITSVDSCGSFPYKEKCPQFSAQPSSEPGMFAKAFAARTSDPFNQQFNRIKTTDFSNYGQPKVASFGASPYDINSKRGYNFEY